MITDLWLRTGGVERREEDERGENVIRGIEGNNNDENTIIILTI